MARTSRRGKPGVEHADSGWCLPGLRCFLLWGFLLANSLLLLLLIAQYNRHLSSQKRQASSVLRNSPVSVTQASEVIGAVATKAQADVAMEPPRKAVAPQAAPARAQATLQQTEVPRQVVPVVQVDEKKPPPAQAAEQPTIQPDEQLVHWVFVTDCSAYMFNQGNLLLTSAYNVGQSGEFTWITYGCRTKRQHEALKQLGHPRAKVWHAPEVELTEPGTGRKYKAFQASNRPVSVNAWFKANQPKEEAIAILDPDMMFMRAVRLSKRDAPQLAESAKGPWITRATTPKMGTGAFYGIGCVPTRWTNEKLRKICADGVEACMRAKSDPTCSQIYSSGPPWILDTLDATEVYGAWMDMGIRVHNAWPDMLAEQSSYGITQMAFGVRNFLDKFWFVSDTGSPAQPWKQIQQISWDPCEARTVPPDLGFPPLFHACSTYDIKGMSGFRLHKDHVHKDLLDCSAPLLHYPPTTALRGRQGRDWREVWSVCTYTNLINYYATAYKTSYCEKPNLEPRFKYPGHAQSFLNASSWLESVFRRGGWTDIDYKVQGH